MVGSGTCVDTTGATRALALQSICAALAGANASLIDSVARVVAYLPFRFISNLTWAGLVAGLFYSITVASRTVAALACVRNTPTLRSSVS